MTTFLITSPISVQTWSQVKQINSSWGSKQPLPHPLPESLVHWNRTLPSSHPLSPMPPPLQRQKESPATCQAVLLLLHSWHLAFYSLPVTRRQQSWPPSTFCCESSLWKILQKILNPANHFKEPFNSFHSGWYFFLRAIIFFLSVANLEIRSKPLWIYTLLKVLLLVYV